MDVASIDRSVPGRRLTGPADLELLLAVTGAGIAVVDEYGIVVEADEQADQLLAGEGASLLGTNVDDLVPCGAHHHRQLRERFREHPSIRTLGDNRPMAVRSLDGRDLHLRIGLSPIEIGERPHTLVVVDDLTAETAHAQSLAHVVGAQEAALAEVQDVEARREAMIAASSHELRTPLTVLIAGIETLSTGWHEMDPATRDSVVEMMRRQSKSLLGLVEDVVDAVREPVEALPVPGVPLDRLVRTHVARWSGRWPTPVELSLDDVEASVTPQSLWRILDELLDNAHRHGVPPVRVGVGRAGRFAFIDVSDAGPGIPQDLSQQAMLPFGRGAAMDPARPGLGLGLTLAKKFAEGNGGSIRVTSSGGVRVLLPRTNQPDHASDPTGRRVLEG